MSQSKPAITVIGSINMDLMIGCETLPTPGQTILAEWSTEVCGGKGANQAVAAARQVTMIGRIGDDAFADRLLANFENAQIQVDHVQQTSDCASGLAVVAVERGGQNLIMVVPGANGRVGVDDILSARSVIESSDVILLQLEIPMESVVAAIEIANAGRCSLDRRILRQHQLHGRNSCSRSIFCVRTNRRPGPSSAILCRIGSPRTLRKGDVQRRDHFGRTRHAAV